MVPGKLQSQAEPEADLSALLAVRQQLPHCGIWVVKPKRIAVGRPSGAGLFVRRTPLNARQGVRVVRKPDDDVYDTLAVHLNAGCVFPYGGESSWAVPPYEGASLAGAYTSSVKEPSGTAIAKAPSSPVMAFPLLSTLPAHAHSPIPSNGRPFGPITLP